MLNLEILGKRRSQELPLFSTACLSRRGREQRRTGDSGAKPDGLALHETLRRAGSAWLRGLGVGWGGKSISPLWCPAPGEEPGEETTPLPAAPFG